MTNEKVDSYIQVLKNPSNKIVKIVAFSGYGKLEWFTKRSKI